MEWDEVDGDLSTEPDPFEGGSEPEPDPVPSGGPNLDMTPDSEKATAARNILDGTGYVVVEESRLPDDFEVNPDE